MNNIVLTKKIAFKAERLHRDKLTTFKKEVFTSYDPSVLKKDKRKFIGILHLKILYQELNFLQLLSKPLGLTYISPFLFSFE